MLVYTSINRSYLPKARILAESLKRQHPDWQFAVLLADTLPEDWDPAMWPFDHVVLHSELGYVNWEGWTFSHTVVELCTAIKGRGALYLIERLQPKKIMYLDPDIRVYGSLSSLEEMLDCYSVLLTPHLLDSESTAEAIVDNEICTLKHGIYNLGFFAAQTTGEGLSFINWWSSRLTEYCVADIPGGLFTDQRWCDLAPCFFNKLHIVRDRGFNVATWNVAHRRITRTKDGEWMAGNVPLRFYHFTGYDSGDGMGMLYKYASDQPAAFMLWDEYAVELAASGQGQPHFDVWKYASFSNGDPITNKMRQLYRKRIDLQKAFPNPYNVTGQHCFYEWWKAEVCAGRVSSTHSNSACKINSFFSNHSMGGKLTWIAALISIAFAIVMFILSVKGGINHFSMVPLWDIWDGGLNFFLDSNHLKAWWSPHNEHRIVLAKVFFWLDYKVFGGTGLPLIALNYMMLGAFAYICIILHKGGESLSRISCIYFSAFFVAWCFQWMQNGNLVWPFQIQFLMAYLIPLISLLALGYSSDKKSELLYFISILMAILSIGTMANGVLVFPLMTVLAYFLRMPLIRVAVLFLITCIAWAIYFYGLASYPSSHSLYDASNILNESLGFIGYVMLFLGASFGYLVGGHYGIIAGIMTGVGACLLVSWLAWRVFTRKGGVRGVDAALTYFAIYIICSGIAVGCGRFHTFGLEQAATSRYTTPSIMLWATLLCGVLRNFSIRRLSRIQVALAIVFLMLVESLMLWRQFETLSWPREHVFEEALGGLALSFGAHDDDAIAKVYPNPRGIETIASKARSAGVSFFQRVPYSVASELQDWNSVKDHLPFFQGVVENIKVIGGDDGRFERIDGWAVAPKGKRPFWGRIVDRDGQVVGAVVYGKKRCDVEAVQGSMGRFSGFSGYALSGTRPFTLIFMSSEPVGSLNIK